MRYEGKVMALSERWAAAADRPAPGRRDRTGDVVSLLKGPAAGQWRRIVQTIDPNTYLVDPPIPAGTEVVSISTGFVGEVFQENRIDIRGGRRSDGFCFRRQPFRDPGDQEPLLGGEQAFRMTACPTETPMMWGWTHAPFLGAVIEGNIIEDPSGEAFWDWSTTRGTSSRTKGGPTWRCRSMTTWFGGPSRSCSQRAAHEAKRAAGGLDPWARSTPHDPGELVVVAEGNRLEAPPGRRVGPSLLIHAAEYNSNGSSIEASSSVEGVGRVQPGVARPRHGRASPLR